MDSRTEEKLKGSHELLIYYEDTDLSGFVYHSNYLKYFERAREHLIGIDFLKNLFIRDGLHFVVSRAQLEYKSPARHGDRILIETDAVYSRSPAINFTQHAFVQEAQQSRLAVSATITIVLLNATNRPVRMPDAVVDAFHKQIGKIK